VSATISVGNGPVGVAFTPDGSKAYVANQFDNTVSVIATASNTVVATIDFGTSPIAFGIFILPRFASLVPTRAIRTQPENLCLCKTAWWGWEDSNLQPNGARTKNTGERFTGMPVSGP
jgi:YVTN family beta-propeller protein